MKLAGLMFGRQKEKDEDRLIREVIAYSRWIVDKTGIFLVLTFIEKDEILIRVKKNEINIQFNKSNDGCFTGPIPVLTLVPPHREYADVTTYYKDFEDAARVTEEIRSKLRLPVLEGDINNNASVWVFDKQPPKYGRRFKSAVHDIHVATEELV